MDIVTMNIVTPLLVGERIRFSPIDHEKDPEIEARWTNDSEYLRNLSTELARPASVALIKKRYEKLEKQIEESKNLFYFAIRRKAEGETPERLIGFARIFWVDWSNGAGNLQLGIGEAADRGQGYGTEALNLLLRYAFRELNLYRVSAAVPEYNQRALRLFEKAGFQIEVRRREAIHRDNCRFDLLQLGLLSDEWHTRLGLRRNGG